MPEAKGSAQSLVERRLAEIAELDGGHDAGGVLEQWDEVSLARREALVAELAEICRSSPMLAGESQSLIEATLERTREIERQIRAERNRFVLALQETETSLKQLGAFGGRMPADAKLFDRLA